MPKLTIKEKIDIANVGGEFQEDHSDWLGIKVRCKDKIGTVVRDLNGAWRVLTVRFADGTEEEIRMNNIGPDPEYIHQYEWLGKETWYRF